MQDDIFDGYFIPGLFIFGQKHGQLKISAQSLTMADDSGNELFNLSKQNISSIKDGLSQISIVATDKKYKVIFRNAVKGFEKQAVLGSVWGTGGKNGIFGAEPQQYGKRVVESLINHGYPAELNRHRSQ
jgi:hypothetical protein